MNDDEPTISESDLIDMLRIPIGTTWPLLLWSLIVINAWISNALRDNCETEWRRLVGTPADEVDAIRRLQRLTAIIDARASRRMIERAMEKEKDYGISDTER